MTAHQREVSPESRIVFRIGINVGDVVVEGDDLLGDGVNIAARLETLTEPGSICISDAVQKHLAGKTDFAFEDTGEHTLKNMAQPVRVWRWAKGSASVPASAPLPLPDRPSIAVLPFDNLSGQPEETYFSDGITEDIITGLARFRSLFVIARNSSFAFRGKPTSLAEIGRQLGVAYLLEGSIRTSGERIRVTAQLAEAATGVHVWADRYDRDLADIFAVQERSLAQSSPLWSAVSKDASPRSRFGGRPQASQPMIVFYAAWPTSEASSRMAIKRHTKCSSGPWCSIRNMPWRTHTSL